MKTILAGNILWSYDYEVMERNTSNDFRHWISGVNPFHKHVGEIILTNEGLIITGDEKLNIPLGDIDQIYLGFDEIFPKTLVKNGGMFGQPLRITLQTGQKLYLIIDLNMLRAKTQYWFDTIKEMLS